MTILVTGSTGTIGSRIVAGLSAAGGVKVRALARSPEKAKFAPGVELAKGDMLDVESMQAALAGVDTLFLLNAVTNDEVTQALITLSLARDAGVQRFVYFSVFNADLFTDVPHFTSKYTVERMIEQCDLPATILRPCYFMQNDASLKDALSNGVYPMPIGGAKAKGVSMVDARDIAELAVAALLQRENAAGPLPRETIEVTGPEPLTGDATAAIWSEVLGQPVAYGGDDLDAFEAQVRSHAPGWVARDMRLMTARFQRDGMAAGSGALADMTARLGHPPRDYRAFAAETAAAWRGA